MNNIPRWVQESIDGADVVETSAGSLYLVHHGSGDNPNAPCEDTIEIRGALPNYPYYGEIRVGTALCNYEISAMYPNPYCDTMEQALDQIVADIAKIDKANAEFKAGRS